MPEETSLQPQDDKAHDFMQRLTPRMRSFAEHYAITGNILRSTTLAGYSPKDTGHGHVLLKREDVKSAVAYYRELYAEKSLYTPEKVLRQWAMMASVDLTQFLTDDYRLKKPSEMTEEQREQFSIALTGLEPTRYGTKAQFAKVDALVNLGKLLKMYEPEEKGGGEGLILNINVGQQVTVEAQDMDLGPFTLHLPEDEAQEP
jgi:hypothetical protein